MWAFVGAVASPLFPAGVIPGTVSLAERASFYGVIGAIYGFIAGTIFAAFIMYAGRKRSLEDLSTRKFGAWSVGASLFFTFPFMLSIVTRRGTGWDLGAISVLICGAILCAGSSAGSLLLAKRGANLEQSQNARMISATETVKELQ